MFFSTFCMPGCAETISLRTGASSSGWRTNVQDTSMGAVRVEAVYLCSDVRVLRYHAPLLNTSKECGDGS